SVSHTDPRTDPGAEPAPGHALAQRLADAGHRVLLFPPSPDARALDLARARTAEHLADDAAAGARLVSSGMTVLTQVARRGGAEAVVVELAHRLQGWAVLLDTEGTVITSAGAGRLHIDDAVSVALSRPVRVRYPDLQTFPVGSGRDLRAYLVVSSRTGSTSRTRDLSAQAAGLIDLVLRTHDHTALERLGREVMVESLSDGSPEMANRVLDRWGVRSAQLQAFALSSRSRSVVLEQLVLHWLDELGQPHLISSDGDRVLGYIAPEQADALAELVTRAADEDRVPVRMGLGAATPVDELADARRQAISAHEIALADALPVAHYRQLPTVSLILDGLDPVAAASLLRPIDRLRAEHPDADALLGAARAFLVEHGSMQATAEKLAVHRHTLRKRLERFESATGLSLHNPDDRFALWMALRADEEGPSERIPPPVEPRTPRRRSPGPAPQPRNPAG
ncbi:helix-turn-helix domain-containing protein, partial [Leucobacter sp. M11]|uniref:helix-turn-helix domain-containing protein n=1 Tax=Leucobacter sp. M11 TaxID=2993565 RepID=UPI002D7F6BC7